MTDARPDLWPLARPVPEHVDDPGPRTLVRLDAEVPVLVAAARRAVTRDPRPWTAAVDDLPPEAAAEVGWRLAGAIRQPSLLRVTEDAVVVVDTGTQVRRDGRVRRTGPGGEAAAMVEDRLAAVPPERRLLETVALTIAEDVVVVDAAARAAWLHVCAPSGWDPGGAGGAPLAALHGPVPTSARLTAASDNLARAIRRSGPHVRWVWGITPDRAAAHHPRSSSPASDRQDVPGGDPGQLTFRVERQTTLPVPELDLGVFLIRVHREPLERAVRTARRARRLAETIAVLPEPLAVYKGVAERRSSLLTWLEARGGGTPDGARRQ